eukprot:434470-Rhodomonas_salina.3
MCGTNLASWYCTQRSGVQIWRVTAVCCTDRAGGTAGGEGGPRAEHHGAPEQDGAAQAQPDALPGSAAAPRLEHVLPCLSRTKRVPNRRNQKKKKKKPTEVRVLTWRLLLPAQHLEPGTAEERAGSCLCARPVLTSRMLLSA